MLYVIGLGFGVVSVLQLLDIIPYSPVAIIPIIWAGYFIILGLCLAFISAIKNNKPNFVDTIISTKYGGCTKEEIVWNNEDSESYSHISKDFSNVHIYLDETYEGDVEIKMVEYRPRNWVQTVAMILTFRKIPSEWKFKVYEKEEA